MIPNDHISTLIVESNLFIIASITSGAEYAGV
jgi:hypothetical protein